MGKIIDLNEKVSHEISELICLKCLNRWLGVYPQDVLLKQIECKCGAIGYVIKTGQSLDFENSKNYFDNGD